MGNSKEILQNFLNTVSRRIGQEQKAKGIRASGESAKSLKSKVSEKGDISRGILTGRDYFLQQEEGRGPTPQGARKSQPTLKDNIRKWIDFKGIGSGKTRKEKEGIAFVIARKIHQEGWNKNGARLDITKIIKEEKKSLVKSTLGLSVDRFRSDILRAFRDGS